MLEIVLDRSPDALRTLTWPEPILRSALRTELTPREFYHDFAHRLDEAERIKQRMRWQYFIQSRPMFHLLTCEPRNFDEGCDIDCPVARAHATSHQFWSEYQAVNDRLVPEDPVYSKAATGVTLSTTNSLWQLLAAASGQMRILESYVGGEAAASSVLRFVVARSAAGSGTTPTTYTPEKFSTRSAAAATTAYGAVSATVAWGTTQESLNNPTIVQAFNAFGGTDRWIAQPGGEDYFVNGEYVSGRSASGTPAVSAHVIFEEL